DLDLGDGLVLAAAGGQYACPLLLRRCLPGRGLLLSPLHGLVLPALLLAGHVLLSPPAGHTHIPQPPCIR
ncbi:MAG: hypothetical protein ACK55Z_17705, partial [bacterium]